MRARAAQGNTRFAVSISTEELFRGTDTDVKNVLEFIVSPNYLLGISFSFSQIKAELVEAWREILTLIN
ncbi:hypothetical protein AD941_09685 [Gluconobacter albidus]|uniref:Uncharacterized protein n=1 Tax=Gluconobacter albidus TaxID=318683 RepID=A0AAW3QWM5_9PROT|nr:hypothetical protein AD941_09685 [Gluconobacter albidus]